MASFTAKDVQSLRERTGCGMMDCKKALTEANGNMDKAVELLREKGLAAAEKKAGRIAAEGLVISKVDGNVGVALEVNAETDFVAKNAEFISFVNAIADTIIAQNPADVEALNACTLAGSEITVEEALREKILTIGENMKIRRFERMEGALVSYVHGDGRIGVLVKFDTDIVGSDAFTAYGRDIAMQIAAVNAQYLNEASIPAEVVEKEKEILTAQAMNEGKPANIAEKMVAGRIKKYFKETCLVDQAFIKDGDLSVQQYTDNTAKALGGSISIAAFVRYEKGEGLEKRNDNFADEVAGMIK